MKKTSAAVKASQDKAGLLPTSLRMTAAQLGAIDALAAELGVSRVKAIVLAVDAYRDGGRAISKARLLAELERRLAE